MRGACIACMGPTTASGQRPSSNRPAASPAHAYSHQHSKMLQVISTQPAARMLHGLSCPVRRLCAPCAAVSNRPGSRATGSTIWHSSDKQATQQPARGRGTRAEHPTDSGGAAGNDMRVKEQVKDMFTSRIRRCVTASQLLRALQELLPTTPPAALQDGARGHASSSSTAADNSSNGSGTCSTSRLSSHHSTSGSDRDSGGRGSRAVPGDSTTSGPQRIRCSSTQPGWKSLSPDNLATLCAHAMMLATQQRVSVADQASGTRHSVGSSTGAGQPLQLAALISDAITSSWPAAGPRCAPASASMVLWAAGRVGAAVPEHVVLGGLQRVARGRVAPEEEQGSHTHSSNRGPSADVEAAAAAAAAARQRGDITPAALSNAVWAAAKLAPGALQGALPALEPLLLDGLPDMSTAQLSAVVWALATAGTPPGSTPQAPTSATSAVHSMPGSRVPSPGHHPAWSEALSEVVAEELWARGPHAFGTRDLFTLLTAFVRWQQRQGGTQGGEDAGGESGGVKRTLVPAMLQKAFAARLYQAPGALAAGRPRAGGGGGGSHKEAAAGALWLLVASMAPHATRQHHGQQQVQADARRLSARVSLALLQLVEGGAHTLGCREVGTGLQLASRALCATHAPDGPALRGDVELAWVGVARALLARLTDLLPPVAAGDRGRALLGRRSGGCGPERSEGAGSSRIGGNIRVDGAHTSRAQSGKDGGADDGSGTVAAGGKLMSGRELVGALNAAWRLQPFVDLPHETRSRCLSLLAHLAASPGALSTADCAAALGAITRLQLPASRSLVHALLGASMAAWLGTAAGGPMDGRSAVIALQEVGRTVRALAVLGLPPPEDWRSAAVAHVCAALATGLCIPSAASTTHAGDTCRSLHDTPSLRLTSTAPVGSPAEQRHAELPPGAQDAAISVLWGCPLVGLELPRHAVHALVQLALAPRSGLGGASHMPPLQVLRLLSAIRAHRVRPVPMWLPRMGRVAFSVAGFTELGPRTAARLLLTLADAVTGGGSHVLGADAPGSCEQRSKGATVARGKVRRPVLAQTLHKALGSGAVVPPGVLPQRLLRSVPVATRRLLVGASMGEGVLLLRALLRLGLVPGPRWLGDLGRVVGREVAGQRVRAAGAGGPTVMTAVPAESPADWPVAGPSGQQAAHPSSPTGGMGGSATEGLAGPVEQQQQQEAVGLGSSAACHQAAGSPATDGEGASGDVADGARAQQQHLLTLAALLVVVRSRVRQQVAAARQLRATQRRARAPASAAPLLQLSSTVQSTLPTARSPGAITDAVGPVPSLLPGLRMKPVRVEAGGDDEVVVPATRRELFGATEQGTRTAAPVAPRVPHTLAARAQATRAACKRLALHILRLAPLRPLPPPVGSVTAGSRSSPGAGAGGGSQQGAARWRRRVPRRVLRVRDKRLRRLLLQLMV